MHRNAAPTTLRAFRVMTTTNEEEDGVLVDGLQEELETTIFRVHELQEALSEAQTIIEQQQEQLLGLRTNAARNRTDVDTFKMKNLLLSLGASSRDEQLRTMLSVCERFESQVDGLTWELERTRRAQEKVTSERDHLMKLLGSREVRPDEYTYKQIVDQCVDTEDRASSRSPVAEREGAERLELVVRVEQAERVQAELLDRLDQQLDLGRQKDRELARLRAALNRLQQGSRQLTDSQQVYADRQRHLESVNEVQDEQIHHLLMELNELRLASETKKESPVIECIQQLQQPVPCDTNKQKQLERTIADRDTWRAYANRLVGRMVGTCEAFLEATPYNEPVFGTSEERRWYVYAMELLELLLKIAPDRVTGLDRELLKRRSQQQPVTEVVVDHEEEVGGGRQTPTGDTMRRTEVVHIIPVQQAQPRRSSPAPPSEPDRLTGIYWETPKRQPRLGFTRRVAKLAATPMLRESNLDAFN